MVIFGEEVIATDSQIIFECGSRNYTFVLQKRLRLLRAKPHRGTILVAAGETRRKKEKYIDRGRWRSHRLKI